MCVKVPSAGFCSAVSSLLLCFVAGILTALHWLCLLVKGGTLCAVLLKESLHKLSLSLNLNTPGAVASTGPGSAVNPCSAPCAEPTVEGGANLSSSGAPPQLQHPNFGPMK